MDLTEIDKVVSCIYTRCDPTSTDSVQVSNLLKVIKPFFEDNMKQLEELQKELDPNNSNPCVSSATFFKAMNQWASQITKNDTLEVTQEFVKEEGLAHSTPRPKDGYYNMLKTCSEIFNMSATSTGDDRETLEEKVKQLQHEISITTNELDEVKRQLNQACEQNEVLTSKLSEMTTNVTALKNTNDELQQYRLEHQEMKEELNLTKLKCERLQTQLNDNLKTYKIVFQEHAELERKKTFLEDQLESLFDKDEVSTKTILDLKVQLKLKHVEISNLKAIVDKLTKELDESKETIEHFEQLLEASRASLEKCLCKNLSKKAKFPTNDLSVESKEFYELSSPGLVQKISIRSEMKPDRNNDNLLKQCLETNIQPKAKELLKKHILDESLPVVLKNLPLSSPFRENTLENTSKSDYVTSIQTTRPVEDQRSCCPTPRRLPKCLKDEMSEVKSAEENPTVPELQNEIERLKSQIKELEDSNKIFEEYFIGSEERKEDLEHTWENIDERLRRIKEFINMLEESDTFSYFIHDQLEIINHSDSSTKILEKLIKSLADYSENIKTKCEHHEESFGIRFEEYTECIHSLITSFPALLSVPKARDLSNLIVSSAKLMGMIKNQSMSLVCFKEILEHVVALEDNSNKVVTPLDASQYIEETEKNEVPLASEEHFHNNRVFQEISECVDEPEQSETGETSSIGKESSGSKQENYRYKKRFLKVLLSIFMVFLFSIFYIQLVQWNCTRMARKVICPFDWLMTKTISSVLF